MSKNPESQQEAVRREIVEGELARFAQFIWRFRLGISAMLLAAAPQISIVEVPTLWYAAVVVGYLALMAAGRVAERWIPARRLGAATAVVDLAAVTLLFLPAPHPMPGAFLPFALPAVVMALYLGKRAAALMLAIGSAAFIIFVYPPAIAGFGQAVVVMGVLIAFTGFLMEMVSRLLEVRVFSAEAVLNATSLAESRNAALKQARTFHEASRGFMRARDGDDLAILATEAIHGALPARMVILALHQPDRDVLRIVASSGDIAYMPRNLRDWPVDRGITGHVFRTGQPHLANDTSIDPHYVEGIPGIGSEPCVPLKFEGSPAGLVSLCCAEKDAFHEGDLQALVMMATIIATAFENLDRFQHELRRRRAADQLRQFAKRLLELRTEKAVYELTAKEARQLFQAPHAAFWIVHDDLVTTAASAGPNGGIQIDDAPISAFPAAKQVCETGVPCILETIDDFEPNHPLSSYRHPSRARSIAAVPVDERGATTGVLMIGSDEESAFTEPDAELLATMAQQAAAALQDVRLYQEARQTSIRLQITGRITRLLSANLDRNRVWTDLAEHLGGLVEFDRLSLLEIDDDGRLSALRVAGAPSGEQETTFAGHVSEGSALGRVIENRMPALLNGSADSGAASEYMADRGFRSGLLMPILSQGRTTAILASGRGNRNAMTPTRSTRCAQSLISSPFQWRVRSNSRKWGANRRG